MSADTAYKVSFRDIERELNRQMKELQGPDHMHLRRARMSNLVIFCDSLDAAIKVNDLVPQLSEQHPSRTILLVGEQGADKEPSVRVTVRPIGDNRRAFTCAEQVTVHAGGNAVARLPFAVRSITIGDLPVNLLWLAPVPPCMGGPLLYELGDSAQQIIYDSLGWPDPARGVAGTAVWLHEAERRGADWRVASDINWRRLKYWRRILTQTLDAASAPGAAAAVREIVVEHGPHASVQGWLLLSWLTHLLGLSIRGGKVTPGVEMAWQARSATGDVALRIRRHEVGEALIDKVAVSTVLDGTPVTVDTVRDGTSRIRTQIHGNDSTARTISIPALTGTDLVARQLSDREPDPVFRECMDTAGMMARGLLH